MRQCSQIVAVCLRSHLFFSSSRSVHPSRSDGNNWLQYFVIITMEVLVILNLNVTLLDKFVIILKDVGQIITKTFKQKRK